MDTYSLASAARRLGTSAPRIRRAVDRLDLPIEQNSSGVFHLTEEQVSDLARELSVTPPIDNMSPTDVRVLAALSRSPRGVSSAREAARRAGVSPTAAGRALARLVAQGLVTQTPIMLARGHASEVTVYQVRFGSAEWLAVAPVVAKVRLPDRASRPRAKRVPPHLLHLFWNTAPGQLDVATSAPYIARRLLTTFDPDGLAWGSVNLPASAWEHAAATRGLEPAQRALAQNLARYARVV
jgi:DNA-binding Lrp family transcriptional regulator